MSDDRGALESLISTLKEERDALKVKVHLAEMEAKDEYDRLSGKIDELSTQYAPVKQAVSESADSVIAALALAAGELKNGFERVRDAIKEQ